MKKRGFGEGKWNGPGGKQEADESIEQTAIRETIEEIGVTPHDIRLMGKLHFSIKDQPQYTYLCHIFVTESWDGEPTESEEMRPQWFRHDEIPYDQMWADDRFWFPFLLQGQLFEGPAFLDGDELLEHDIKAVKQLSE